MRKLWMPVSFVVAACAAAEFVHASVTEQDFFSDVPIVLSVSRLPQRLDETPGVLTVLGRDFIRRSGARDLADLLRLVPGFQSSASFYSTAPLASYHGAFDAFSNRMQVMVDGRSIYSPYFIGSVGAGLQTVALEDIERLEVLRGSNSAAYGARAMLGVINIVTQHTADTQGAQGTFTTGQNGVQDVHARWGGSWGKATYRLSVDQRADDGLAGSNGHNQVRRVNFRSDFFNRAGDEVQIRMGDMVIDANKGLPDNRDNPFRGSRFELAYVQADWHRSLSANEDLAATWSHTQESYLDEFPYALREFGIDDNYIVSGSGRSSGDALTLQHTQRYSPTVRMVVGGEFRSEKVNSVALYATDADLRTDFLRLFGNVEWRVLPSVLVNVGALTEDSNVSGASTSPRLMVNWQFLPGQTLRAGSSRAYRPPSTYEQFANVRYVWQGVLLGINTVSSGQVVPERMDVNEVSYLGDFPRWRAGLDVRAYREKLNGFIRQQNAALPRDYANEEDFAIQGWEYQLKWRPWTGAEFVINQAYTDIGSIRPYTGTPFAAPKRATALIYFQKFSNGLDLTLSHQDNGTATLAGTGWLSRTAMTRSDVRLGWPLRWGTHSGELALTVQNLGAPYPDYFVGHYFERRAFVTLRLDH